jgi:hypothetical protein
MGAAQKEFSNLWERETFQSVTASLLSPTKTLTLMWILTYKYDIGIFLTKFKACLVVHGDMQYDSLSIDNYAATLATCTFCALMDITAAFDMEA